METVIKTIESSCLYKEFFINLPAPLNNVYFLILIFSVVVYIVVSNIVDLIIMRKRHKELVRKAAEVHPEPDINANILGFLQAMQQAFNARSRNAETVVIAEQPVNYIEQKETYFEATMREQRQKEQKLKELEEQKEKARLKAEAIKEELAKEEFRAY